MRKYQYKSLGCDVPDKIEKEYNRMLRREQYLEENDIIHGLMHVDNDAYLESVPDPVSLPEYLLELENERIRQKRLEILPAALDWLKRMYPDDYEIIFEYFLSSKRTTQNLLAKKYDISHQGVRRRLEVAKSRLKHFITLHEKYNE